MPTDTRPEWAVGPPQTPAQWAYELALIIARARHGPGVDMGGKHNPRPSEQRAAREFVDAILAASGGVTEGLTPQRLVSLLAAECASERGIVHMTPQHIVDRIWPALSSQEPVT